MANQKFKAGDLVELKSGGPVMTVEEMFMTDARCVWFAGDKHQSNVFALATLKAAEDDE